MARVVRFCAVALCALTLPASAAGGTDGMYAVVVQWPHSHWQHFALRLQGEAGTLYLNGRERAVTVARAGDVLDVRWPNAVAGEGHFHGMLGEDGGTTTYAGSFTQGGSEGPFQALRLADVSPKTLAERDGVYRVGADRYVLVARSNESGGQPVFLDTGNRRTGVLVPVSPAEAVSGPSVEALLPIAARFEFAPGPAGAMTVRYGNAAPLAAARVDPYRTEDVTFRNGEVTLRGTLFVPAGSGPHPGIILIHGSGPEHRPLGLYPFGFLHEGFAVLAFDKRGAGESTGDYRTASFEDLAGDVVAGVELLKRNAAVDPHRIGIFASSNGGWVAPVVAARSRDVAFIVCRVCSMVTVGENVAWETEGRARDAGLSDADVARAVALREEYVRAVLSDTGWDALRAKIEAGKNSGWVDASGVPTSGLPPDPVRRAQQAAQLGFDPAPYWRRVTLPTLFLYAENDRSVKTAVSAPRAAQYLREAGNRDVTIVVLDRADHGFLESQTGLPSEMQRANRFTAGFPDAMDRWLQGHHLTTAR